MLRIIRITILPGVLLSSCMLGVCADSPRADSLSADSVPNSTVSDNTAPSTAAVTGKQIYSNRPAGYTIAVPYYGTPMVPRFMVRQANNTPNNNTAAQASTSDTPVVSVAPIVPVTPIAPVAPIAPVVPVALPQVVEKTAYILCEPQPEADVNDELDACYARLAKIQVEKHQLDEALTLVQMIKSKRSKVKTIVDLTEYVSRDKNYQSESEHLYRLAIAGLDALNRNQPFNVLIMDAQPSVVAPQPVVPAQPIPTQPLPAQPAPVAEPPAVTPLTSVTPAVTPPVVTPLRPQPIPLDDEPLVHPPVSPPAKPEAPNPNVPTSRPPILLPEDSAKSGRPILPPPAPPRDEHNGIAVSPQMENHTQRT